MSQPKPLPDPSWRAGKPHSLILSFVGYLIHSFIIHPTENHSSHASIFSAQRWCLRQSDLPKTWTKIGQTLVSSSFFHSMWWSNLDHTTKVANKLIEIWWFKRSCTMKWTFFMGSCSQSFHVRPNTLPVKAGQVTTSARPHRPTCAKTCKGKNVRFP